MRHDGDRLIPVDSHIDVSGAILVLGQRSQRCWFYNGSIVYELKVGTVW